MKCPSNAPIVGPPCKQAQIELPAIYLHGVCYRNCTGIVLLPNAPSIDDITTPPIATIPQASQTETIKDDSQTQAATPLPDAATSANHKRIFILALAFILILVAATNFSK
jgi:hypothetical protein